MKKAALVLFMVAVAGGAAEADIHMFSPVSGDHNWIPGSPDMCWSQPPDLNDTKISSEIIAGYGFESEAANDFVPHPGVTMLILAIGYGGYYGWAQGDPPITSLNWTFYDDGGCAPHDLLSVFTGMGTATFAGYDGFGFPTYKHELTLDQEVLAGEIYWFGLQAADHPFPPQWGRQGTGGLVTSCDTMYKSAFFGVPQWTPAGDLLGTQFDAAQELVFEHGPTATKETTWGSIKRRYR